MVNQLLVAFWSLSAAALLRELQTSAAGLTSAEAQERLARYGLNRLKAKSRSDSLTLFLGQFKSPIILILLFAAALSLFLGDASDASIIIAIVFVSGLLGFWQERGATDAVEKLLAIVEVRAAVLRDGKEQEISVEEGEVLSCGMNSGFLKNRRQAHSLEPMGGMSDGKQES